MGTLLRETESGCEELSWGKIEIHHTLQDFYTVFVGDGQYIFKFEFVFLFEPGYMRVEYHSMILAELLLTNEVFILNSEIIIN